jgi:ribonuclease HII
VTEPLGAEDRVLLRDADDLIGVDEVGRGALAGPVVIGAVRITGFEEHPFVRDSKKLSRGRREQAAAWLRSQCDGWVVLEIWPETIDRFNILEATRRGMTAAVQSLCGPGSIVVTDAVSLTMDGLRVKSPVRADDRYFAVAAASILAKVHRDRLMVGLDCGRPDWGWKTNVGYPTAHHRKTLEKHGASYVHRRTFRVKPMLP